VGTTVFPGPSTLCVEAFLRPTLDSSLGETLSVSWGDFFPKQMGTQIMIWTTRRTSEATTRKMTAFATLTFPRVESLHFDFEVKMMLAMQIP